MKVFIAGPRAISKLNKRVEERLYNIYNKQLTVVVGDANGVDKAIQQYFYNLKYKNVFVYASLGKARCNIGNWKIENVEVKKKIRGYDFYAAKDLKMAEDADYGFMLWNGKSKGTLNNIINLTNRNKKTLIYFTKDNQFYSINKLSDFEKILNKCDEETKILFNNLLNKSAQLLIAEENTGFIDDDKSLF